MAFYFFAAMTSSHLRVRQSPEHGVDTHEDGLRKDPCDVDALGLNLLHSHVDVVLARIVTADGGVQRRARYLWRWTVHEYDHSVVSTDEPGEISSCTTN
jgi:hypothetical protein